jgi:hypothetical protein
MLEVKPQFPKRAVKERTMRSAFIIVLAGAMTIGGAWAASDLQRARALNKQSQDLLNHMPKKTFEGEKGKAYCKWLDNIHPVQSELLQILLANAKLTGIGATPQTHEELVRNTKTRIQTIEAHRVTCRLGAAIEELEEYNGDNEDELED